MYVIVNVYSIECRMHTLCKIHTGYAFYNHSPPHMFHPSVCLISEIHPNRKFRKFTHDNDHYLCIQLVHVMGIGSKLRVGGLWFAVSAHKNFEVMPPAIPLKSSKACIQCASTRSISTMYNQPYTQKCKFSKCKPSILHPKIARQYNNQSIDQQHLAG